MEPIWEKELNEKFTLIEYPKQPNFLNCSIYYDDGDFEQTFAFGSWGCDRDSISVEDCLLCCQVMLAYDANVSMSSFASNLEYARNATEDDEDEEE